MCRRLPERQRGAGRELSRVSAPIRAGSTEQRSWNWKCRGRRLSFKERVPKRQESPAAGEAARRTKPLHEELPAVARAQNKGAFKKYH